MCSIEARGCGCQNTANQSTMSLNESCAGHSCENCRTLLHMHTRTCMCGALFGLRAALKGALVDRRDCFAGHALRICVMAWFPVTLGMPVR